MDKHEPEKPPTFTADQLTVLLQESVIALNNDKNYPADFRAPLKTFQPVILPVTLSEINSLCRAAISTDDFDDFCKKFYTSLISQGQSCFPQLRAELANLLMKKLFERIMVEITKKQDMDNPFDVPIKDVEMDVIQNMSGYVVKTFMRKFQKRPGSRISNSFWRFGYLKMF